MGRRARVRPSQSEPISHKKKMDALARELEKGEMNIADAKRIVGLDKNSFAAFISSMTYVYPIYQYGTAKDTFFGILKK
ncbi:MAG: hypothetical protein J6V90_08015 [Treponema sp.]|nr:hypothetical protein [Treponema sp.]